MSKSYSSLIEAIEEQNHRFVVVLFEFKNALMVFYYEGEFVKLGTLAVAIPQFEGKTCISSILLGERNAIFTKILAEHLSNAYGGMVLVSTHLPLIKEDRISGVIFKLTKKILDKFLLK